ncbi:MAG: hypothetical protein RIK87_03615 [Fuerstiella sp.]
MTGLTGTDFLKTQTFVLLGASNLTLAWPRIMSVIEAQTSGPREVFTAHGMGRSYIAERSSFGVRQLPGILNSGLWSALRSASAPAESPAVLITDLGNDLVFGSSPEEVAEGAAECVRRIRAWNRDTRIVLTAPPLKSVERLGQAGFIFFRSVLFPKCRLSLSDVQGHTRELDERLSELSEQQSLTLFSPASEWYGLDPIHIRRRYQREAFAAMTYPWNLVETVGKIRKERRHRRPVAETRWVWGRERRTLQPSTDVRTAVYAY